MKKWQQGWDKCEKGCWTKELLPVVTVDRPPPTFAMAQVLSGHGVFVAYLHRFKRRRSPMCACGEGEETPLCLLYTSPSPRDRTRSRMPSSA